MQNEGVFRQQTGIVTAVHKRIIMEIPVIGDLLIEREGGRGIFQVFHTIYIPFFTTMQY